MAHTRVASSLPPLALVPVLLLYLAPPDPTRRHPQQLLAFVRDVYSIEPIARAVNMTHIKMHYYTSHPHLNTFAIIPVGNGADLTVPHGRGPPLAELNVMAAGVGGGEGKE